MMKIKNWSISISANLIDGGSYMIHFYDSYCGKKMTLDEVIEWLQNFKKNVVIIKKEEDE